MLFVTEVYELFYILDIIPSFNIWFANIFFYSIGLLFTLLLVALAVQKFLVSCSPTCELLFLLLMLVVSYPKKIISQSNVKKFFHYAFFWEFYSIGAYVQVFNPFWVNFYELYKTGIQFYFSFKYWLTIDVRAYFCFLYSVLLVCMSIFVLALHCFNYYTLYD